MVKREKTLLKLFNMFLNLVKMLQNCFTLHSCLLNQVELEIQRLCINKISS